MVITKGAIKMYQKDMQQLNSDSRNKHPIHFHITDAVRLKMKVKDMNEETEVERWAWKESRAVRLTFRSKDFPPHVYFCNM
jgi:hypothetical protein